MPVATAAPTEAAHAPAVVALAPAASAPMVARAALLVANAGADAVEVDSQASTIAAGLPAPVAHEVVIAPPKRARSVSRGMGLAHDSSKFHELATEGLRNVRRDLKNRCFYFPAPLAGEVACEFRGKADGATDILTNDLVRFEWSYRCDVGGGIVVRGSALNQHRARDVIYGKLPPRMPRNAMDAVCLAKIYERFFQ